MGFLYFSMSFLGGTAFFLYFSMSFLWFFYSFLLPFSEAICPHLYGFLAVNGSWMLTDFQVPSSTVSKGLPQADT